MLPRLSMHYNVTTSTIPHMAPALTILNRFVGQLRHDIVGYVPSELNQKYTIDSNK